MERRSIVLPLTATLALLVAIGGCGGGGPGGGDAGVTPDGDTSDAGPADMGPADAGLTCATLDCGANGTCVAGPPAQCDCDDGYEGARCELDIDECTRDLDDCGLNSMCMNTTGGFTCPCVLPATSDGAGGCECPAGTEGDGCTECASGFLRRSTDGMCAAERTLTIDFSGDGAGTVEVAGQSCDASAGSCAFAVGDGDTVRITATGRSTDDPSWSAGSCSGAECDVAISGDATVTLTWTLRHNIAFITSADYVAGNIGSVANADSLCAQAATAAGLHPTSWVALLGSVAACPGEVSGPCVPFDRLAGARGWVNTRGEPLFDMPDQLGPSTDLWFPVRYDEDGAGDEDRQIVTGLNILGAVANNCTDYTDNASASRTAWARAGTTSTNAFSQNSNGSCALAYHLFCLSTDHTDPLPAPNAVGRLVFVTEQLFTPTTGLTTADAMCQREACDAGLTGGTDCNGADPGSLRTFRALLETEGATAGSRFDSTGPDYVRADGVPVLAAASLAGPTASISPASTLDLYADGRRVAGTSNTFIGASGGETCSDWSSDQNDARSLINDNVFFTFDRVATRPCSGVARVICLEE